MTNRLSRRKSHARRIQRVIESTRRVTYTSRRRSRKDPARNTGRCRTSWRWLMTCWLASRSNVSRATNAHTVWVECAPRRRVDRSATVVRITHRVLANGLYRRRARNWDPGFRMRARSQESSTQAPRTGRLSLPDAPTRLVSLRLPYSPACRCSPAPAYMPGG